MAAVLQVFDFSKFAFEINPEMGLTLLRRLMNSGSLSAGYSSDRYELSLIGVFMGKHRDLDPVTGSRFDFHGRLLFAGAFGKIDPASLIRLHRSVSAIARIDNLFNQRYEEILGFPAYKLHFSAGLRVTFRGER